MSFYTFTYTHYTYTFMSVRSFSFLSQVFFVLHFHWKLFHLGVHPLCEMLPFFSPPYLTVQVATSAVEVGVLPTGDVLTCFCCHELLIYCVSVCFVGWYNMIATVLSDVDLLVKLSYACIHNRWCMCSLLHTWFTEMRSKGANVILEGSIHVLQMQI